MSLDYLHQQLRRQLPRARLTPTRPAGCSGVALYLFDPAAMEGPLSHEEAQAMVAEPAYWTFCWASGQVLAQYLLTHPEQVHGKRVIDFGSGSGIVAIAAALAGAREAIACDLDPLALAAAQVNAQLNGVDIVLCDDWFRHRGETDLVTAADVLYDPDNRPFLDAFRAAAPEVLLADSRIKHLADPAYTALDEVVCRTAPDLNEFEEFNKVRLYRACR
ncbi:MAG: 50S ribosomal protein L11 methyltransferase [Gammaproteobacteria bacterium]|nr:50S ribosomal protein L11 methyltransferase [Gammaproteobacteria bacterium]